MRKDELWGFCEPCESWMCTAGWFEKGRRDPACPVCGVPPALIEFREGDRGQITVKLRLPPGAVEPVL
jgi:hypothetical protein